MNIQVNTRAIIAPIYICGSIPVIGIRSELEGAMPYPFPTEVDAPLALPPQQTSFTQIRAIWEAVTGATGYRIDVAEDEKFIIEVQTNTAISASANSYTVEGLIPGKEYYYRLRAEKSGKTSANSNVIRSVTALVNPLALPASSILSNGFTANWEPVFGATGYRLDVSTAADFATFVRNYQDVAVSGTSHPVVDLTPNTTYYYRLRSITIHATSANSETISLLTLSALGIISVGNGSSQQSFRLGNSQDCTISVLTGTIISVSAGTVAPGGKSAVISAIADSGSSDYRTVTLAAYGAGDVQDTLAITNYHSLHYLLWGEVANGSVMRYSGALPAGLTYLYLNGANLNWTYSGALPAGLTALYLIGANLNWTYSGALPAGLTALYLIGANLNWIGTSFGSTPNITIFSLSDYRITKLSTPDLLTILSLLASRIGAVPNTIIINDYADYASPPQAVTDAIAQLKSHKTNVTTVTLGA